MYRRNSLARGASSPADPYADLFSLADSSSRVSFLHRPPGQSMLRRHDSVTSLNTEGSFYQEGSLDNIPDRAEDEVEDDDENQWPGAQDEKKNDDASDGEEANSESEGNSTVYGSVHSRANTPSSASAYGGNEEYQSGWDSDTLGQGTPREHTPTPTGKVEYLSYFYSTTTPPRPTESISVPTSYKTRSGQIPGSYVGKHATPKRRGGGESISASPYSKKGTGKKDSK